MLILVVGPSGAGKDTLIGIARQALANDQRFRFVRRVITRPPDPEGEDHEPVSETAFAQRDFALSWQAHGLHYGIPADITRDLARGIIVVANVSRNVLTDAARRFPVSIIQVTASPNVLALRLSARGRESLDDMEQRLTREVLLPNHVTTETIVNDATPAEAADRFIASLIRAAPPAPR